MLLKEHYQDYSATVKMEDCEILEGNLSLKQLRLVAAWIEIHREELMADWVLFRMVKSLILLNLKNK